MSRKNHSAIGGRLVRTDKGFSDLKRKQQEKISGWLYEEYAKLYEQNGLPPDKRYTNKILDIVSEKIEAADIWLPVCDWRNIILAGETITAGDMKNQGRMTKMSKSDSKASLTISKRTFVKYILQMFF